MITSLLSSNLCKVIDQDIEFYRSELFVHPSHDMDSLKWFMYAFNYEKKAKHFKHDCPELNIVECDVHVYSKDENRKDTVIYYFSFFKDCEKELYSPVQSFIHGIGYSYKSNYFFPVTTGTFPRYVKGRDNYDHLFISQVERFTDFLTRYRGTLSPWLRNEAIKRGILTVER